MVQRPSLAVLTLVLFASLCPVALADDGETESPAAPPPAEVVDEFVVGVVTGDRVNLRVGPRVDNRAITQLPQGTVLVITEQRADWLGVHVPRGFPAAVSLKYVTPVGPDAVRVAARKLNFRVEPPEKGKPAPGIFMDHPERGALLTLVQILEPPAEESETPRGIASSGWAWVVVPEEVRAFIHKDYVKRLGPVSEHAELLVAARGRRIAAAARLSTARRDEAARVAAQRLMESVGTVQQDLYRLRQAGGTDKTPIVALANRLDAALQAESRAADTVLRLGRALREDLEREITLRVARHDAAVAKHRGLNPPAVPPLEPMVEGFEQSGEIRYEPTPGWKDDGVYFLWVDGRPRYALRLTTGGPLPHPKFEDHTGAGPRHLAGRLSGDRLFGLPVFEVTTVDVPK